MNMYNKLYADYTEDQLIKEALNVQDACNLQGVSKSFAALVQRIADLQREAYEKTGKPYSGYTIAQHRACRLFASKIQSLTGDVELNDFNEVLNNE